jgi:hypothetical protein
MSDAMHEKVAHESAINGNTGSGHEELLQRYQTAQTVVIPREIFEQIYLEPTANRKGSRLGLIFGNPTPMYAAPPDHDETVEMLNIDLSGRWWAS